MPVDGAFASVAVIGFGLIGGSIAAAVRRAAPNTRILALDRPATLAQPCVQSLADAFVNAEDEAATAAALAAADLTLVATPVDIIQRHLPRWLDHAQRLTDCGSTKGTICSAVATHPRRALFVPGHPMAGSTQHGAQHARADLFDARPWLICPTSATGQEPKQRVIDFVARLGAQPVELTPDAHDEAVAITSHVPQLIASHLLLQCYQHAAEPTAGPGFHSSTRVAGGSSAMWEPIFRANGPAVARAARELAAALTASADALDRGDVEAVTAVLEAARHKRR